MDRWTDGKRDRERKRKETEEGRRESKDGGHCDKTPATYKPSFRSLRKFLISIKTRQAFVAVVLRSNWITGSWTYKDLSLSSFAETPVTHVYDRYLQCLITDVETIQIIPRIKIRNN